MSQFLPKRKTPLSNKAHDLWVMWTVHVKNESIPY
jgi:hypothetical protein